MMIKTTTAPTKLEAIDQINTEKLGKPEDLIVNSVCFHGKTCTKVGSNIVNAKTVNHSVLLCNAPPTIINLISPNKLE